MVWHRVYDNHTTVCEIQAFNEAVMNVFSFALVRRMNLLRVIFDPDIVIGTKMSAQEMSK